VNEALVVAHMEKDMMTIPYSPIAVNTGSKLVVIDTGTGEANFEKTKGVSGQFDGNLKASGIDRNHVDIVIISHFHGDHINGLLAADNKPAFPNAEVLVPAAEWKYFMDDAEMGKQTTDRMKGVFSNARRVFDALNRKVTPYEPGKEVAPGITSVATYGQTPGHKSHVVSSGSATVYVQADVTNNPVLFARNPGWHAFFDQDGAMAEATRRKVYDMLAADKMMVQGFHYPFPAVAFVEKTGSGYREILGIRHSDADPRHPSKRVGKAAASGGLSARQLTGRRARPICPLHENAGCSKKFPPPPCHPGTGVALAPPCRPDLRLRQTSPIEFPPLAIFR
jgi:glyoxylase-like metal-dependent hydrolase (beta-lactamase superfamily II)